MAISFGTEKTTHLKIRYNSGEMFNCVTLHSSTADYMS